MTSLGRLLLSLLPAAGVLAAPAPVVPLGGAKPRSPEFYKRIEAMFGNATERAALRERSTVFSSSQDGVDSAGFYYSLYNPNSAAVGYTEFSTTGEFEIGWDLSSSTEFLGGKGYKSTSTKTITWSGYFTATDVYTLAIYGWTLDPVTEWYIVEDHGSNTYGNGDVIGTVSSDGGTYKVYDLYYSDVTEIYGVTAFHQYWSVRESTRTTGTVSVTNHFNGWKDLGLDPGTPIFQMVCLEGFSGQGYLDFTVS